MQVVDLDSANATRRFYEMRYAQGYMDLWGGDRHRRLREILAELEPPPGARVLDFGCGSGGLTGLLTELWPHAEVHGADISDTAIQHARERVPGASFHALRDSFVERHAGRFDLVFSHHVLEHVYDLEATIAQVATLTAPGGRMLHTLPCGNAGSLAHWLCRQRPDGIDAEHGNRFFFEEASHLRRLRTSDLEAAFARHGCQLRGAAYGYHWVGVLRLMTEMTPPGWFAMVHPLRCHRRSLPLLLLLLLLVAIVAALRAPAQILLRCRRVWQQVYRFQSRRLTQLSTMLLLSLALPALLLAPISVPAEIGLRAADDREWRRRRQDPAGSEMFLRFERGQPQPRTGRGQHQVADLATAAAEA